MSGIEIAGLVLGAFPILIHALESYREGAEHARDWWQIKRAYKKCRQELTYHQLLFEGNVQRFLLPLVADEDELVKLMADPMGAGWRDPDLELRLKDRLPKGYDLFLNIVQEISALMESLRKDMGVDDPAFLTKVDGSSHVPLKATAMHDLLSRSNLEFQTKRLKFSLKRNSRERLFRQLQQAGDRMRNLLETSDQVAAARNLGWSKRPSQLIQRQLSEFWRHAQRLHEALSNAWQCGCMSHIANLGLEHRTSMKLEFDVFFDLMTAGMRHTRIQVVDKPQITNNPVPRGSSRPRQVRFQSPAPSLNPTQGLTQIDDLCATLLATCPGCLGYLEEDEHRFLVFPNAQSQLPSHLPTKSLQELLVSSEPLTRRRRYCLALTLASSYLQLGATPWLNTRLRKESIIFLQDQSKPEGVLIDHPYIRREMSRQGNNQPVDALSSLGVRLLELCYGVPLENTRFRKQYPSGDPKVDPKLDYVAAIEWSKLAGEEAGPEFAEAIEWCLYTKELPDGSWRKDMLQHVVLPLDACHKQVS